MWQEFRLKKGPKFLIWKIRNLGTSYETEHGQLDGAKQTFTDTPGDKGKPGTKAYVSSEDNCSFHISREIRKKEEHGYIEYVNGSPVSQQISEIKFNKALPKHFCSFKPQTDIDPKTLEKLHKTGKAKYSRKYDGQCHLAVHHTTGWEIYTRRMDLATEKFPHHIKELEAKSEFGVGTILVGECVCSKLDGKDDFKAVSRFCRSLIPEARKLIEDKEIPEPELIIFDMLFHNGQDLKNKSYDERHAIWKCLPQRGGKTLINSVDFFNVTPNSWEKVAKDNKWEGFVVTDGASVPGEKFFSFDGDSKRPKGHHKLKPYYEEDVVIYATLWGSGKYQGTIGAAFIKQRYPKLIPGTEELHPQAGQWFSCGKVGSGFDDESRSEVETLCKQQNIPILDRDKQVELVDINNDDGIVTMIEYGERQPGTQKFRFPVFVRTRTDKLPKECYAQRLAADDEEE